MGRIMDILNKLKSRKKSILGFIILGITGFIGWKIFVSLFPERAAKLGSTEAQFRLIKIESIELPCKEPNGEDIKYYPWELTKIYINAAESDYEYARLNLLSMAKGQGDIYLKMNGCHERMIKLSQRTALSSLNALFESNPTRIENWIDWKEEPFMALNVISYYYSSSEPDLVYLCFDRDKYRDYAVKLLNKTVKFYQDKYKYSSEKYELDSDKDSDTYVFLELASLAKRLSEEDLAKDLYNQVLLMGNKKYREKAEFALVEMMLRSDQEQAMNKIQKLAEQDNIEALFFMAGRVGYGIGELARMYYSRIINKIEDNSLYIYYDDVAFKSRVLVGIYDSYDEMQRKYHYDLLEKARCDTFFYYKNYYCSIKLASVYFSLGKYDKARAIDEDILKYDNTKVSSLSRLAQIYYKGLGVRQDLEKAKEYYGKLCDLKEQKYCDLFREVNEKIR